MKQNSFKCLTHLNKGESAYILDFFRDTDEKIQHKLLSMGVLPGRKISLLRKFPSYVFEVGNSRFAVDAEIAKAISISKTNTSP